MTCGLTMRRFAALTACIAVLWPVLATGGGALPVQGTIETAFSPRQDPSSLAVKAIHNARKRVWLAGYSFTHAGIAKAIAEARRRGLDVRVVLDKSQQTERYSGATYLANAGVPVRINSLYPIMHHKLLLADDVVGLGSMNFTKSGAERNAENFNLVSVGPQFAAVYASEFARLEAEATPYHPPRSH